MGKDAVAEAKIRKARTTLYINKAPFWGQLSLQMDLVERPDIETMATDGTSLFYNPEHVKSFSHEDLVFDWAHNTCHNAMKHPYRRDGRDPDLWNEACNYCVNDILKRSGFLLPDWAEYDSRFAHKSAEAIYSILYLERKNQQGQGKGKPKGHQKQNPSGFMMDPPEPEPKEDNTPPEEEKGKDKDDQQNPDQDDQNQNGQEDENEGGEGDEEEEGQGGQDKQKKPQPQPQNQQPQQQPQQQPKKQKRQLTQEDWDINVTQATFTATKAGQMPVGLELDIKEAKRVQSDLMQELRQFVEKTIPHDYSWLTPHRGFIQYGIIIPGFEKENCPEMVIAVDTSGSMVSDQRVLNSVTTLLKRLFDEFHPPKVTVIYCDTEVAGVEVFKDGERTIKLDPKGGGGTNFQPVFNYIKKMKEQPACCVYFTDLEAFDDYKEPPYPVLWVTMPDVSMEAKFGKTCRINDYMLE